MDRKRITDRQEALFLAAALSAPVAQTASVCSWPAALAVGALCLLSLWGLGQLETPAGPWLSRAQGLWASVLLSQVLLWSGACWQDLALGRLAGLALLGLAVWGVRKGGPAAARAGCALARPIGLFLAVVLLSALPEVRLEHLTPRWQLPSAALIPVLLLPALDHRRLRGRGLLPALGAAAGALAVSAVTAGVLAPAVSAAAASPIYQLSRSISIFGRVRRFESLMAAALTLGYYACASWLLAAQRRLIPGKGTLPVGAALAGVLFLTGWEADSRLLAVGSIILWVLLPLLTALVRNFQNAEKSS